MEKLDILSIFDSEPCILLAGEKFDVSSEKNRRIINLPWSCIFTSSNNVEYSKKFINSNRKPRDIFNVKDINEKALDKRNLRIVRLFGNTDTINRSAQIEAYRFLSKIQEMFESFGKVFLVGFDEGEKLSIEKLCDLLDQLRNNSVIIFDENNYLLTTDTFEIAKERSFLWLKNEINNYLNDEVQEYEDEYEYVEIDNQKNQLYINKKLSTIEKDDIFEISSFATLLNIQEVNGTYIPPYLIENYFYTFLKESAYSPQWYGYENGFNLVREFEDDLYEKTVKSLENPGNLRQKPICLYGQSGSGKSVAMANLAYKIFNNKRFPVIFMNNKNINFSNNIYNKNGEVKQVKSKQFEVITQTIEILEGREAESVLIIWDLSAATKRDVERVINLYSKLRNRGRNIQLLFTSYEIIEEEKTKGNPLYDRIQATVKLTEKEKNEGKFIKNLKAILKRKARIPESDISALINQISFDKNLNVMSTLYLTFFEVRMPMQIGVQREATTSIQGILDSLKTGNESYYSKTSMQVAIEKSFGKEWLISTENSDNNINNNVKIENLLIIVCICSKYNLSITIDLAYRFVDSFNFQIIRQILSIPVFDFDENEEGTYSFRIRTKLEAEMLLKSYGITQEREIEYICKMISKVNSFGSYNYDVESSLINQLLVRIGPNSGQHFQVDDMLQFYPKIIYALSQLREDTGGCTKLTLQEIVYIREYNNLKKNKSDEIDSIQDVINELQKAIDIGEKEIVQCKKYDDNFELLSTLIIEVSNTKLSLHEFLDSSDVKILSRIHRDIKDIIVSNPDNSYAYNLLLRLSLREYDLSVVESDRFEILSEMCEIIDRVRSEHQTIALAHYFFEPADKIYEKMDNNDVDTYFDELIESGSYAGIFVKSKQMLQKAKIDIYKKADDEISEEQIGVCKQICENYLENIEYVHIINSSYQCQQLLLRIKWLIFNRSPIFSSYEPQYTKMTRIEWSELKEICEKCKINFIDTNSIDFYSANTFLYVLALIYAQFDDFKNAYKIINIIKQKTEYWLFDNRIKVRHIICEENGTFRKFDGRFIANTDPTEDRGYIEIFKIKKEHNSGKLGVYYHKRNMKSITNRQSGQYYSDFQLGLGFMGFGVYRGLKSEAGEIHE